MPWNNDKDSSAHNRKAVGASGEKWRRTANAILRETGSEERAIRVANAALAKHEGAPTKRFGKKTSS